MRLLLVRHAIAFERSATRWPDDGERPLTPEGIARARKAAQGLRRILEPPEQVLVSPLTRAQQTAALLTRFAGWPVGTPCAELLPSATPVEFLALLPRSREGCIGAVGHEPGLSRLMAACVPGQPAEAAFEMKKMGVALLAFPGVARVGRGRLVWLLAPKVLRAAR